MATSIKILLWDKPNKDKLYPIALRITKSRKTNYIYLGHYIKKEHWDENNRKVKKSHPNSTRLNNLIAAKFAEVSDKVIDLQTDKKDTSSKSIKKNVTGDVDASFKPQANAYLDNLRSSGKYNRISAEEPRVNRFLEFVGGDISLKEITVPLLNKYRAYLKSTRSITERTIVNHLVIIRSIYNQAKKGHLIDPKHYPFGSDKIHIKFPDSIKIGLTMEEVEMLETIDLQNKREHHARNLWLFSFYFAGMRVSDVLRLTWSEIIDGRLYYSMGKNNKADSLRIPIKAQNILDQYIHTKDETNLVFPELKSVADLNDTFSVQKRIKTKLAAINILLETIRKKTSIEKNITMHIPRHSFGNISGKRISPQILQKLYRHTDIKTTMGYQSNFIHDNVDEALSAVLGF